MKELSQQIGIYIHIPFCQNSKCWYCDFYSVKYSPKLVDKYLISLERELKRRLDKWLNNYLIPYSIYIGGGTPSSLSYRQLVRLLSIIYKYIPRDSIKEFTIEVNPETIDSEKLKIFLEFGISRISVGIQSFQKHILEYLGRYYKINNEELIQEISSHGFGNISIDLLYGVPHQEKKDFLSDVYYAINLPITHISIYLLTIEENGDFYPPDIESFYYEARDLLEQNGFFQYEISNFAKPGYECRHNLNYWEYGNWLGFGAGAVSKTKNIYRYNSPNVYKYINRLEYTEEFISEKDRIKELIMMKLRTRKGISFDEVKDLPSQIKYKIENMLKEGYLEKNEKFYTITLSYLFVSNEIIGEIIDF